MPISPRLVVTSVPSAKVADALAHALVTEKLAACVTRLAGARSTYVWKGELCTEDELVCLIKTTADRVDALLARLPALHPYEVPEALVLEVSSGLPPYLAWLMASTR